MARTPNPQASSLKSPVGNLEPYQRPTPHSIIGSTDTDASTIHSYINSAPDRLILLYTIISDTCQVLCPQVRVRGPPQAESLDWIHLLIGVCNEAKKEEGQPG